MPGDTSVANNGFRNVNAVQKQIQEAQRNGDKKLFVKHKFFGKNGLVVKSSGASSKYRLIRALKPREASDKDILKALSRAAKKDMGPLGPKAVSLYMSRKGASVKSRTLASDVASNANAIAKLSKLKNRITLELARKGVNKSDRKRLSDAIFSDDGDLPKSASRMLKHSVTTNILTTFADKEQSGECIRFLMDKDKADEIWDQLEKKTNGTPAQQQDLNAKKHAVYDFLIDRYLFRLTDLDLPAEITRLAKDCPIGQGTDNDQALDKKKELVNKMKNFVQINANDTHNKLNIVNLIEIVQDMSMDEISKPMTKHRNGDAFLSLELAETTTANLSGLEDETLTNSEDASPVPVELKTNPFPDGLGGPLGGIYEKFLSKENSPDIDPIRNHPNTLQLTENEMAEIEGMIVNPDISDFFVVKRAKEILNGK